MTEDEYNAAISEIRRLWDSPPGTPDGDRLSVLFDEVVAYENIHYPILDVDFPMNKLD